MSSPRSTLVAAAAVLVALGTALAVALVGREGPAPPDVPAPEIASTTHGAAPPRAAVETARAAAEQVDEAQVQVSTASEEEDEDLPPEEFFEASDGEFLERLGLPPDTPLSRRIDRWGPPDPIETGRASLRLRLFDRGSGAPLGGEVVLWRIGAPGNEYWSEGDQDVAVRRVPADGCVFEGLAAGTYRPQVWSERDGAPEPEPLVVAGATAHDLFVEPPREIPVRLSISGDGVVVEAAFEPLEVLERTGERVPSWVRARAMRPLDEAWEFVGEANMSSDAFGPTWVVLERLPDGYDAGTLTEDTRGYRRRRRVHVRVDGAEWPDVVLSHQGRGTADTLTVLATPPAR